MGAVPDHTYPGRGREPCTFARSAEYYGLRIRWAVRLVETTPPPAAALGAANLEEMQTVARRWFPALVAQNSERMHHVTCPTWEAALVAN